MSASPRAFGADIFKKVPAISKEFHVDSLRFGFNSFAEHFLLIPSHATAINGIMSEIIFVALLTSILIIALNLYALESNDLFSLQTGVGYALMMCLLPMIFAFCFLAERITTNLYEIGDIFYDASWYRLPAKQQRIVICPIQRAGQEFRFRSLGLVDCSLTTFLSVP